MNILPQIHFLFSKLPLSPDKLLDLDALCRDFIWNGKCPGISFSTLSHPKASGCLSLPNFKHYYWVFQLRTINTWLDTSSEVPWHSLENASSFPIRIQDLPFSAIKQKTVQSRMGPIISNTHTIWRCIEQFHALCPIWHNNALLSGSTHFIFPQWSEKGIHYLFIFLY